jgi:hypothetical protein
MLNDDVPHHLCPHPDHGPSGQAGPSPLTAGASTARDPVGLAEPPALGPDSASALEDCESAPAPARNAGAVRMLNEEC